MKKPKPEKCSACPAEAAPGEIFCLGCRALLDEMMEDAIRRLPADADPEEEGAACMGCELALVLVGPEAARKTLQAKRGQP